MITCMQHGAFPSLLHFVVQTIKWTRGIYHGIYSTFYRLRPINSLTWAANYGAER